MIQAIRYTEELERVGFSTEQAKKSVQVWMDLMDQNFATKSDFKEHYFMTKTDLKDVQNEMRTLKVDLQTEMKDLKIDLQTEMKDFRSEFQEFKKDVDTKLTNLEHRLTIRLGAIMATSVLVLAAINTYK